MEPPSRGDMHTVKESQAALFRAVVEADPAHYVRGQCDGYQDIKGVASNSTTETTPAWVGGAPLGCPLDGLSLAAA